MSIYNIVTIGSAFFLVVLILLQTRGASLGAGMGGGGEVNTVRRGSDKSVHQITIVSVIVFIASIILGIIKT
jgi:preprotein translocase subunit SecG